MAFEGTCHFCKTPLRLDFIGFRDECPKCAEPLHACLQCRHYAPGKPHDCNEPNVEPVRDKDKNNRCDWFKFGPSGAGGGLSKTAADDMLKQLFKKS